MMFRYDQGRATDLYPGVMVFKSRPEHCLSFLSLPSFPPGKGGNINSNQTTTAILQIAFISFFIKSLKNFFLIKYVSSCLWNAQQQIVICRPTQLPVI